MAEAVSRSQQKLYTHQPANLVPMRPTNRRKWYTSKPAPPYRGMDELYRHGMAYKNALARGQNPESFYEKRLLYFASGIGNQIVDERLRQSGKASIVIPKLRIDSEVPTSFSDYKVHRCLFENQPPFVSGALERLCL